MKNIQILDKLIFDIYENTYDIELCNCNGGNCDCNSQCICNNRCACNSQRVFNEYEGEYYGKLYDTLNKAM